jgi:hypothetical protein
MGLGRSQDVGIIVERRNLQRFPHRPFKKHKFCTVFLRVAAFAARKIG